jgi:non-ribosomal peptide synthetase component F
VTRFSNAPRTISYCAGRDDAREPLFTAERVDHPFPKQLVADMRALAANEHCSFFAVVLGGLSILLARAPRQDRFVLALPFADQPTIGQPNLVGHCVTLLPFLAEIRESESLSSFLDRVQTQIAEIHDHRSSNLLDLLHDLHRVTPAKGISPTSVGLTDTKSFELQSSLAG